MFYGFPHNEMRIPLSQMMHGGQFHAMPQQPQVMPPMPQQAMQAAPMGRLSQLAFRPDFRTVSV